MSVASDVKQYSKKSRSDQARQPHVHTMLLTTILENLMVDDASVSGDLLASLLACLSVLVELAATQQKEMAYPIQLVLAKSSEVATQLAVSDDNHCETVQLLRGSICSAASLRTTLNSGLVQCWKQFEVCVIPPTMNVLVAEY